LNFFDVRVRLNRPHFMFEITEEDGLMGHEEFTIRQVDDHPGNLEAARSARRTTPQQQMAQRRWYAEDLQLQASVRRNVAVIEAFAAVARERFLGPGPWRILPDRYGGDYFMTPDDDPRWIYHDVLVAIDHTRGLNNGMPSFWARNFDHLDLQRDQRVMQVGAGTGYYAAVLAEIVGTNGRVIAVECDRELAAKARTNLGPWRQVEVVHGDGRTHDPGEVDVIIVFAGSTHPAPLWLDRLAPGGQLLMPLTNDNQWGFLLRATRPRDYDAESIVLPEARDRNRFDATSIGGVGIFPCVGGRDEEAVKRFQTALEELGRGSNFAEIPIEALHRGDPGPAVMDKVWHQGPGFWLERKQARSKKIS
jgi:protein-L-isoaspartate(D-aspartate) O-methyltransferase